MARRVKRAKVEPEIVGPVDGVEFVNLPVARKLVVIDIDLTNTEDPFDTSVIDRAKGAIVKPVIRYNEGTDAKKDAEQFMELLRKTAKHVRPPEYDVVRKRRRRVDEGFGKDTTMMEAAEAFMLARPPGMHPDEVHGRLGQLFEQVEQGPVAEVTHANPITIRSVVIEGFMLFKNRQEILLDDGVYGVVGLNRSGKSTLMDAIEFAFTGSTGRNPRSNDWYIHPEAKQAYVETVLDVDGKSFSIARTIDAKGHTSVDVTGCEGAKVGEADELIRDTIGLGRQDLLWTCIVRQRDLGGLLGQTSAPMQDALFRWLGIGTWSTVEKIANGLVEKAETKLSDLERDAAEVDERLGVKPPTATQVEVMKMEIDELRDIDASIRAAEQENDRLGELIDMVDQAATLPELKKKLDDATLHHERARANWSTKNARAKQHEKDLNEARALASDGFDGTCPVDDCECPRTSEINKDVDKHREAEHAADASYVVVKHAADVARIDMDEADEARDDANLEHDNVLQCVEQVKGEPSRSKLCKQLASAERKLIKLKDGQKKTDPRDISKQAEYEDALVARSNNAKDVKRLVEVVKLLDGARESLAVDRYVRLLCSRQGVPAMIVEGAIGVVEQSANDTLERLDAPHRLEFSFETEIKKPASTCRACGAPFPKTAKVKECEMCGNVRGREIKYELKPWIVEGDGGHHYCMDSGGGQDLVALSVRVALSRFMGSVLLLVDEACANLDDVKVAAFTSMIARLSDVGFRQVLVSSHRGEVKDSTEKHIVAVRDGNASTIKLEG